MKGLIIKDLLFLKSTWKNLIVIFIGSLLISIAIGNYLLAISVVPIMLLSSGINTFQTDEFYNTESFTLSFPLSRKKIVLAKYLFTLILLLLAVYVSLIIYFGIGVTIKPNSNGLNIDMLKTFSMLLFSSLFVNSVFYPVIYKYGCEKSRFVLMSIVMVLLGVVALASAYINTNHIELDFKGFVDFIQAYGVYAIGGFCTVCFIASYFLSILFYRHKDY
ncbi:MAG: ABC-2 transporter permease [Bacilli bacterium]|nr:ABC-2 transporter permease [Bacilli bacterium]